MRTIRINFPHLPNETHVECHGTICNLIERFTPATLGVQNQYIEYKAAYNAEFKILDEIRKSEYTKMIADMDNARDRIFYGLVNAVKSASDHYDTAMQEAAKRVSFVLDTYHNIAGKSYNSESAAITDLINELRDTRLNEVTLLSLDGWLNELENKNQTFRDLMSARDTETANKAVNNPPLNMRQARKTVDRLFRSMRDFIEALILTAPTDKLIDFLKELNAILERYKRLT